MNSCAPEGWTVLAPLVYFYSARSTRDTLSWFRANLSLFKFKAVCLAEQHHIQILYCLVWTERDSRRAHHRCCYIWQDIYAHCIPIIWVSISEFLTGNKWVYLYCKFFFFFGLKTFTDIWSPTIMHVVRYLRSNFSKPWGLGWLNELVVGSNSSWIPACHQYGVGSRPAL